MEVLTSTLAHSVKAWSQHILPQPRHEFFWLDSWIGCRLHLIWSEESLFYSTPRYEDVLLMSLLTLSGTCITTNVLEVWNQSQERFWPNNMFQSSMMFSLDILHLFWGLVSFHSLSWFVHGIFLIIYFGFLCLLTWSTDSRRFFGPGVTLDKPSSDRVAGGDMR